MVEHCLDIVVVVVERHDRPQIGALFLGNEVEEEPLLALEIDVERSLGDARHLGDVVHAGSIEAFSQEDLARALEDLVVLLDVLPRRQVEWRGPNLIYQRHVHAPSATSRSKPQNLQSSTG